ncbi:MULTISPECIES: hypothetical protein [unclassified Dietzia]|uniref:hypothetical protein n=1 Tax=unclassified Dietzia TaxID=2617939 RepID=UPI000D211C85|nr:MULTISPECIES: hypothetical protein [unclassified Dietzia]AVZ38150.1 hypothetical protein CT688_00245 [Dietzia sp. JS16-p6b]MBB1026050.1 hypothetical protein [Dietzia sp. DQ12-76]MBB1028270.1 hypothetical protein [Dietzia sp. DQ11-38-2]QGW23120.1 hypothetical protein GJR88_00086 [Dietzia sp. DQ12-45-1b]
MATEMLHTYMQDHHAGAAAGVDLFRRVAKDHEDPEIREVVARIGDETEEDLHSLEELMTLAGTAPSALKDLPARAAEKLGQLKPNQRFAQRSPLSDLLELEALTIAVRGKELGFRALLDIGDPRLPQPTLEALVERAVEHGAQLEKLRLKCTGALRES